MTSRFLDTYLTIVPKAKIGARQCLEMQTLGDLANSLAANEGNDTRLPSSTAFNAARTGSTSSNGPTPPTAQTVTPTGSNVLQVNPTDEFAQFSFADPIQNAYGGNSDKYDFNYLGTNNPAGNVDSERSQPQPQAMAQPQAQVQMLAGMSMEGASGASTFASQFRSDVTPFPRDGPTGMQMAFGALPADLFVKGVMEPSAQQGQEDIMRWV